MMNQNTYMMKKTAVLTLTLFWFSIKLYSQQNIVPLPVEVIQGKGNFTLQSSTSIDVGEGLEVEANYLVDILETSFQRKTILKSSKKGIRLRLDSSLPDSLGSEGYKLKITSKAIEVSARESAGIFYGIQSLRQLLPPEFEGKPGSLSKVKIPSIEIIDYPRFSWRAFMLDESRHFKGKEVVKKLLDQIALLKMNVFHWHLTDDQGWRIEIKKYPKLTEIGSYRKDTQAKRKSEERVGYPHSGYYSQEDIKEVIEYANKRHILIVPEIEMPGHAMAAIAAYPWLGVIGTSTEVPEEFGIFQDSYNVADPKVFKFLTDVLDEVFNLFPGNIVHIGGDEVKYGAWKESPTIQQKIKEEGLESPADLQIFFTNEISKYIESKGHRMMGWNEILGVNVHEWQSNEEIKVEQKLSPKAIVHFWKGSPELVELAVSQGNDVVNSYHKFTYLDYNYKTIPLEKAYSFDPIPEGLSEKYYSKVLGSGCQMWSEWIPTVERMEQQVFPRLAAYAEVGWTQKKLMEFENFSKRLTAIEKKWDFSNIHYHKQE